MNRVDMLCSSQQKAPSFGTLITIDKGRKFCTKRCYLIQIPCSHLNFSRNSSPTLLLLLYFKLQLFDSMLFLLPFEIFSSNCTFHPTVCSYLCCLLLLLLVLLQPAPPPPAKPLLLLLFLLLLLLTLQSTPPPPAPPPHPPAA